jgi:hypothetical protein
VIEKAKLLSPLNSSLDNRNFVSEPTGFATGQAEINISESIALRSLDNKSALLSPVIPSLDIFA